MKLGSLKETPDSSIPCIQQQRFQFIKRGSSLSEFLTRRMVFDQYLIKRAPSNSHSDFIRCHCLHIFTFERSTRTPNIRYHRSYETCRPSFDTYILNMHLGRHDQQVHNSRLTMLKPILSHRRAFITIRYYSLHLSSLVDFTNYQLCLLKL